MNGLLGVFKPSDAAAGFRGCCGPALLPLYVFCGEQLLCAYLRRSDIDAAKNSRAVLKLLVDKLRAAWPEVKIVFRGDSGFCRWKLMRWCDRHEVGYVIGLARNPRLAAITEPLMQQAEQDYHKTQQKQRQFHRIDYAAHTWDRARSVIVKAERLDQGPNLRLVVTNLSPEQTPPPPAPEAQGEAMSWEQSLYDQVYCARGEMENRIKEQQLGLFADRTSCATMLANQFRLLLSSAAYTLFEHLPGGRVDGRRTRKWANLVMHFTLVSIWFTFAWYGRSVPTESDVVHPAVCE